MKKTKKVISLVLAAILSLGLSFVNAPKVEAHETTSFVFESDAITKVPAGTYYIDSLSVSNLTNATVDLTGCTFIGGGYSGALRALGCKNVTVIGGTFRPEKSMDGIGLRVQNKSSLVLKNVKFLNYEQAARIDSGNVEYQNCTIKNVNLIGITINNKGTKVTYNGGSIEKCGQRSDASQGGKPDAHAAGVGVYNGGTFIAKNTTIKNNHGCGIAVLNNGSGKSYVKVYGSTISGNGDHGIGAGPSADVTIDRLKVKGKYKNTVVKNNKYDGVMLLPKCTSSKIAYLTATGNGRDGLAVSEGSTAKKIENCTLNKNSRSGLMVYNGTAKNVNKCTCNQNGSYGVSASENGVINSMTKCTVKKNKAYGVVSMNRSKIKKVSKCTIKNNKEGQTYCMEDSVLKLK